MIIATFNGNPHTTVVSCYSPTNVCEETDVIEFYGHLDSLVRSVPKHYVLVVGGDMNAHIGLSDGHKHCYHDATHRNGEHMFNFTNENGLVCLNTRYQKMKGNYGPSLILTEPKLNYLFINKKWINSVINCEAYNTFQGVYSDHRIASLKIRLRANKKQALNRTRYDHYTTVVKNRLSALQADDEFTTANSTYENFVRSHHEAAAKCIPVKPKIKSRVPWESKQVIEKRVCLKKASNLKRTKPTKSNMAKFKKAQKDLVETYVSEQRLYVLSQIDKLKNAAENRQSSVAWKTVNEVTGRKTSSNSKLKATSQEERLKLWKEHFQNLLGKPPSVSDKPIETIINYTLNIKLGHFTTTELEAVKGRKAAGLDDIPPEGWKRGEFNDILLQLCDEVYAQNAIDKWTEGCILPFPKKGDLGITQNYRGITLTAIAAKTNNSMLRNRIHPEIENVLRRTQNGFRKNRSTGSQILTVRRIIEGVRARKAFDSIHRGKMEQILLAYGIPKETVDAIMMLYKNTRAKVRSPDGDRFFRHPRRCTTRRHIGAVPVCSMSGLCTENLSGQNQ